MPLYEYECTACGHRFERIQKFSDPPVDKCPVCGGAVAKLVSSPAFQFKGSGWYVTDYARKAEGSKTSEKPAGESSTEKSTTESKDTSKEPAAKESAKPSDSKTTS